MLGVPGAPAMAESAPLAFHPLTTARAGAVSDGVRYVAYARRAGVVDVVDDATGTRFEMKLPEGTCWAPQAVGGGIVLMECSASYPPRAELIDIRSRRALAPAGLAAVASAFQGDYVVDLDRVGSSWIGGVAEAYHDHNHRFYLNWRTGELRDRVDERGAVPDLNSPALMVALCDPLARLPFDENAQYVPPDYVDGVSARVVLRRCGSAGKQEIGWRATSTQLGAGAVSWLHRTTRFVEPAGVGVTVNAYRIRGRRLYRRTFPRISRDWSLVSLLHTAKRLYLSVRVRRAYRIRAAAFGR